MLLYSLGMLTLPMYTSSVGVLIVHFFKVFQSQIFDEQISSHAFIMSNS